MTTNQKTIVISAVKNGLFWSVVLLILLYLKNRIIYYNYLPLWFLFFAVTGALRKYFFINKQQKH